LHATVAARTGIDTTPRIIDATPHVIDATPHVIDGRRATR
jgi:hypothetical protein